MCNVLTYVEDSGRLLHTSESKCEMIVLCHEFETVWLEDP